MKVKVQFEVEIPVDDVTDDQIEEWLRFSLNDNGSMQIANPLSEHEVNPVRGTFDWS